MATSQERAEKYANWLVNNQDKKGTSEWDTVSSAYREIRQQAAAPAPTAQEGGAMETLADVGAGLGSGVVRGIEAAASLPDLAGRGISAALQYPMGLLGIERITPEEKEKAQILDIQKDIIQPTATAAGARYEPETVYGELAQRTGELLPFAAAKPVKFALAPAAAGYAAEEAAEEAGAGEGLQLAARLAGEIAAPLPAGKAIDTVRAIADLRKTKDLSELAKSPSLTEAQSKRMQRAARLEDQGIRVSAAQAVGDDAALRAEAQTSGAAEFMQSQLENFTSAVMQKIGSSSKFADSAALTEAQGRIGGVMNEVLSGANTKLSAGDARKFSKALQKFKSLKPSGVEIESMNNYFANVNRRIANAAVGKPLTPDEYISFRGELSKLTMRSEKAVRDTATDMLNVLDGAMDKTLSDLGRPEDFERLKDARRMYRDYIAVEDAALRAGAAQANDLISPSAMSSALKKQSKRQYGQAKRGDLGDLASDADAVLRFPKTSGTAENLVAAIGPAVAKYGSRGLVGSGVASVVGIDPRIGAAIATIGPATFDRLALTEKGVQYLTNQMVKSDPTFFTKDNARMIVGAIANAIKEQEQ